MTPEFISRISSRLPQPTIDGLVAQAANAMWAAGATDVKTRTENGLVIVEGYVD